MNVRLGSAACAACVVAAAAGAARASSGIDSPDNGALQLGRGGAWVARADDPLAAYFNPAALVTQASGVHLGVHLMLSDQCFTRLGPDGRPVAPSPTTPSIPAPGSEGGPDAEVCADAGIFPNPQVAAAFRLDDRFAVGLALLGPHAIGSHAWPESLTYTSAMFGETTQPSPQRYLLVSSEGTILQPTLSVAFAPAPEIAIGAGFVWGIAIVESINFSEATSPAGDTSDDFNTHNDILTRVQASDLFIPGFVLGALWSPTSRLDVAAWFKWQDAVRAKVDLHLESRYWNTGGTKDETPCEGEAEGCNITDEAEAGDLTFRIPMEAKLGLRYHHPRPGADRPAWAGAGGPAARRVRDPMSEDLFDVEVDFTWANNSTVDAIEVRFREGIPVRGTDVGFVPVNGDTPHGWKDVLGVRVGGDLVALPSLLAVRAGGFYETKGQDEAYLNLDFHLGWRLGLSGGATVRLGPVDVSAAYQHTFFGALDNGGNGKVKAISGSAATNYRSPQSVNGGRFESSLDEFALSGTLRF